MITMIQFEKCGMTINYPIAKIDCIALDAMKEEVLIGVTGMEETQIVNFDNVEYAEEFYNKCLDKIEAYYQAMMTKVYCNYPGYLRK